ncbi:hypothetical protein GMSM_13960 [Geomonas sp. Red276]
MNPMHNLLFRLNGLTRRWRQVLDAEFQSSGLTDATWRPLLHLSVLGDGIRQKELAASLGLEGPSLVRLLDTLIDKGLIERSEDEQDRRAKQLALTGKGRELVETIRTTLTTLEEQVFKPFNEQEIEQLNDFVQRLESTVNELRDRVKH